MNDDSESDLVSKLPYEIQTTLKRKSSRDPNSRFPRKLHLLLTYIGNNPSLEEQMGLGWVNETEFKMNKKIVSQVMGIKLNTMNVNLRDLRFEQLQHDKNGWTRWKRNGFTKSSIFNDHQSDLGNPIITDEGQNQKKRKLTKDIFTESGFKGNNLSVGSISKLEKERFEEIVKETWAYMFPNNIGNAVTHEAFIRKAAEVFKQEEQPLENAKEVIQAIIAPVDQPTIHITDLYRFLAMFGPKDTAMLKIAVLLQYSNDSGHWLHFTTDPPQDVTSNFTGSFDFNQPNCLVLRYKTGEIIKVWNNPLKLAHSPYLIDDKNCPYNEWEHFFTSRIQSSVMDSLYH